MGKASKKLTVVPKEEGDNKKSMAFMTAMMDFFGKKPGQTLGGFKLELDKLDDADREYFKRGLEQNGYIITSVKGKAVEQQVAAAA